MNTSPKSSKPAEGAEADLPETQALFAEVSELRSELRALMDQAAVVTATAKGGAKIAARALAAEGAQAGSQAADGLIAEWRSFDRKVVGETRENPWRSLGVAAFIGMLFGIYLRR